MTIALKAIVLGALAPLRLTRWSGSGVVAWLRPVPRGSISEIVEFGKERSRRRNIRVSTCGPGQRMPAQSHATPIISRRSDKVRISASGVSGILSGTWLERLHQIMWKPKAFAEYASQPLDET
jgi:hypothetical protein